MLRNDAKQASGYRRACPALTRTFPAGLSRGGTQQRPRVTLTTNGNVLAATKHGDRPDIKNHVSAIVDAREGAEALGPTMGPTTTSASLG